MKEKSKISKLVIIAILMIALLNLSVGYAQVSDGVYVSGIASVKDTFSLRFSNAKVEKVVGANRSRTTAKISMDGKILSVNVSDLAYPGAGVEFSVDIVNEGTIPAVVKRIYATNNGESIIQINRLDKIENTKQILEAGEQYTIRFSVEWPIEQAISLDEKISFDIQIEYEQA